MWGVCVVVHIWGFEWSQHGVRTGWVLTIFIIFHLLSYRVAQNVCLCVCLHTHTHTHTHTHNLILSWPGHSLFRGNKLGLSGPRPLSYESSFDYEPNGPSKAFKLFNVIFNFLPFACCGSSLKKKLYKKVFKRNPPTCNLYAIEGLNCLTLFIFLIWFMIITF